MRYSIFAAWLAVACGASQPHPGQRDASASILREGFDAPERLRRSWLTSIPNVIGAAVHIDDETLKVTSPGKDEVAVRHRLDLSIVRGKRVRVRARARTSANTALARATVTVQSTSGLSSYPDRASTRSVSSKSWSNIDTVIDVQRGAATVELALVAHGEGTVWFDDIDVSVLSDAPRPMSTHLSKQQLDHLITLTRAVGYIRYLHPSDQAATCDWDAFLPMAVFEVMSMRSGASLRDQLTKLFASVAPTVSFHSESERAVAALPRETASHVARWRHFGLGSSGPFTSFREGRDAENQVADRRIRVRLANPKTCGTAQLDAIARSSPGADASLFVRVRRPGQRPSNNDRAITAESREFSIKAEIPADLQELTAGIRIQGRGSVTLESLSVVCQDGRRTPVAITQDWESAGPKTLYQWTVRKCESGQCGTLEREPLETDLDADRDILNIDIGSGLHMHMPVALWSTTDHTLPKHELEEFPRNATIDDLHARLAAVSATWSSLALFYPYFKDLQINWDAALPVALQAAAAADSPGRTHEVLSRLVAALRDDHARVMHDGAPIDGTVPLTLRRFGDKLVVVGGLPEYLETIPVGTDVLSIDGVPALQEYDRVHERVSAATQGWHDYATPFYLNLGPAGTFRHFRFRMTDGTERGVALPLVSRDVYDAVREPRPKSGTELAPGVVYVDLEGIRAETWQSLLPSLQRSRAIILDLRGYTTNAGMDVVTYMTDRELMSPVWEIPIVTGHGPPLFETSRWTKFPAPTRLAAAMVVLVDGRSASAVETILQMIHEAKLAVLVGETSGGTNGNTNTFNVPGEFQVRFTGMRVSDNAGATIQGRGITPDKVVRPTLHGVRAGRDEILEAGVTEARRLARD